MTESKLWPIEPKFAQLLDSISQLINSPDGLQFSLECLARTFKNLTERRKVRNTSTEYQNNMNNMGDRNRSRVIIRERGDGSEGALCTGEFWKGPFRKPLFAPPSTCARCEPVLILVSQRQIQPVREGSIVLYSTVAVSDREPVTIIISDPITN